MLTIYRDAADSVVVIDGVPPVDQTAEVAALTAQVTALQNKVAAALVAAQSVVAALNA